MIEWRVVKVGAVRPKINGNEEGGIPHMPMTRRIMNL